MNKGKISNFYWMDSQEINRFVFRLKIMCVLIFFLIVSNFSFAQESLPALNQQIVDLAYTKLGKKVDRGECWDLAAFVLNKSGASWDKYMEYGRKINHKREEILPGDIIQFTRVKIKYEENGSIFFESMGMHTAVIVKKLGKNKFLMLEQNTDRHGRKVGESILRLDAIVKGKIEIYRPVR